MFIVSSNDVEHEEIQQIISHFEFPCNDSFNILVNLESLKEIKFFYLSSDSAVIHLPRANKLLLILLPSLFLSIWI